MTSSTQGVALQVDDVYVPLGLVERKKQPKPQGDISPEQGSELYKETEITKTYEHDDFLEEVLKQKNTPKSKGKRIAIIGEPGAGKTTLLQQIADWVSRDIQKSIVIWVSLADLQGQKLEEYLLKTWLTAAVRKKGKAKPTQQQENDFVALFQQNHVWLVLDGLDEMSASNPLTEIARQFRESGLISQARIVLTCRVNLWDAGINALDDFDIYRTLNFSYPEQVEKFIYKWFAANPEAGKRLCNALKEPGKERIQDLVKNPLRLTLLCLNWQSGDGKLPDTQAGLYQQFVDDFYKWKKEEIVTNSNQHRQLNLKLGELAKAAIDKEVTRFRLRQDIVSQFLGDADDDNSLFKLAVNRGWLNQVGIDTTRKPVYAFFHASFQEYFAATAIDDWHFFLNHVPKNPSKGIYRIFEPQWKQTILLWLGRPEENLKRQKQQFINALINFKDGCGKCNREDVDKGLYEYQAYFLAAVGIAEFRHCSQTDEIVNQIVKWCFGYYNTRKQKWVRFINIAEEARETLRHTNRTEAIAALVKLLNLNQVDDYILTQVAETLKQIDSDNEQAITVLLQLIKVSKLNNYNPMLVLKTLGKIGHGNHQVITVLVNLINTIAVDNTVDKYICMQLLETLGKIGYGNEQAITALTKILKSNKVDNAILFLAEQSLSKIGIGNEKAIIAVVELLISNEVNDPLRKKKASEILEEIGIGNKTAINALVQLVKSSEIDDYIRRQAIESLGKIGTGDEQAITALEKLLQSKNINDYTFKLVVKNLGRIGTSNQKVTASLEQLLQSPDLDNNLLWQVADSLVKINPSHLQAINALEQLLQSPDLDNNLLWQVADSLVKINPSHLQAINVLVQLLQSTDVDNSIRSQVTNSLGKISAGNLQAINALVQLLTLYEVNNSIFAYAAQSLGQIALGNEQAISSLVQLLISNEVDQFTLTQAAKSLEQICTNNKQAITNIIKVVSSHQVNKYNKFLAVNILKEILQNNQFGKIIADLQPYLNDSQLFVSCHSLIWHFTQNMPYPDFYQAWHQHNFATRAMRSLKKILFTKII
ncbi:HEAT repeat domain-containing protein [Nostoc spongiaeforme]|uniref:HEAT repeat domain-containing protein n=1 Tax=Nostoc spongiaeforme TaxID=502487 RepID=UPI0018F01903|nr:HEAT repeat domain-containing protein [Nostoc spongiaeforme]